LEWSGVEWIGKLEVPRKGIIMIMRGSGSKTKNMHERRMVMSYETKSIDGIEIATPIGMSFRM
jgi:hypothetical protein